MKAWVKYLVLFATALSLFVVMLGAYTRLTDAGLGCPDWPGCYGKMVLPSKADELARVQNTYPEIRVEQTKAWTEMAHRYVAGTLALLIIFIFFTSRFYKNFPKKIPALLIILVIFQALLGMWTVTLKLLPIVVMAHLLGGISIFALLSVLSASLFANKLKAGNSKFTNLALIGLLVIFGQIALGGWVSANYAGVSCVGFPTCNGIWFPKLDFAQGFFLFSPIGTNYQGGVLLQNARITVQFIHRIGAVITALYISFMAIRLIIRAQDITLTRIAWALLMVVTLQFSLGIINVLYLLPLGVAVLHNGVAAILCALCSVALLLTKGEQRFVSKS